MLLYRYDFQPCGQTMHTEVLKKLNHQKPKATKWLKFKDFFNTQRVALLLGLRLLVIGTAVYLAVTPAPQGEDEPVQKQQAPTLERRSSPHAGADAAAGRGFGAYPG